MVLLKNSVLVEIFAKIQLHAVLACTESDSAQANTALSRKLKCLQANPRLANTAQSRTLRRLTLSGVNFLIFENLHFQGI